MIQVLVYLKLKAFFNLLQELAIGITPKKGNMLSKFIKKRNKVVLF